LVRPSALPVRTGHAGRARKEALSAAGKYEHQGVFSARISRPLAPGSGSAIEIAWDLSLTPYLAIWACNGNLGGNRQIAIEPATGGNDHPDPAAPPPLLEPGDELRWWLEIRDRRA
jgi:hypothetical protein